MKIGYLLNSYPMTSTTFIRREIEALEEQGLAVMRYAVRPWAEKLVDPRDIAEAGKTHYLLAGNAPALFGAGAAMLLRTPGRFFEACGLALGLWRNARGGLVRHAAYFLQGAYLARRARHDGIGHIHAHFSTNAAAVAMLAHVMGGPGYSFTVHGPDEFDDAKLLSLPEKIGRARFVVAISGYCRSQLIRFASSAFKDKIRIVRCGVFLDEFAFTPPAAASRTLVCVGRLAPQKGQALLPRVLARVRARIPDAKIVLIGDGPERAAIEHAIRAEGVAGAFEILGWRDNREVLRLMREARAFLLPTAAEGLPIVIMEAMALGRPVISTYVAGIPELLDGSCGWIVPAGDEAALGAAIVAAFEADDATLAGLGCEARARIEALHEQRANATTLKAMFEEHCTGEASNADY